MSMHQRLEIEKWKRICSLAEVRERTGTAVTTGGVTGPCDMAVLEQLREQTYGLEPGIERLPTDVFIWSYGESAQRHLTQIGGLPYWEVKRPWPLSPAGTPLTFVAQLCFADSRDLWPSLPGDVLLIFTEAWNWGTEEKPLYDFMQNSEADSYLLLEWVSFHDRPLISREQMPKTGLPILPCFAARIHRTWDAPEINGFAYPEVAKYIEPIIAATKIGGAAPWPGDRSWYEYPEELSENYLCSLCSTRPWDSERLYPFLNVADLDELPDEEVRNSLKIGDMGHINIYLRTDGTMYWHLIVSS